MSGEHKPKVFLDVHRLTEDSRIEMIGDTAISGRVVAFVVDAEGTDGYAKADRYIKKLKQRFPSLRIVFRGEGPVDNCITVKVSL
jgi:hypothetical protein